MRDFTITISVTGSKMTTIFRDAAEWHIKQIDFELLQTELYPVITRFMDNITEIANDNDLDATPPAA